MRNRFKNTLYTVEDLKYLNGRWQYVRSEDGALFSGPYRTKIKPEDLLEWYVYGRYYKRFRCILITFFKSSNSCLQFSVFQS